MLHESGEHRSRNVSFYQFLVRHNFSSYRNCCGNIHLHIRGLFRSSLLNIYDRASRGKCLTTGARQLQPQKSSVVDHFPMTFFWHKTFFERLSDVTGRRQSQCLKDVKRGQCRWQYSIFKREKCWESFERFRECVVKPVPMVSWKRIERKCKQMLFTD